MSVFTNFTNTPLGGLDNYKQRDYGIRTNIDGVGGNNDTATVVNDQITDAEYDPTSNRIDVERQHNTETNANVDRPRTMAQRQHYRDAAHHNQEMLAQQFFSKSGFNEGDVTYTRDGDTLTAEASGDVGNDGNLDSASYSSTLTTQNDGNRTNYTIKAEGQVNYEDMNLPTAALYSQADTTPDVTQLDGTSNVDVNDVSESGGSSTNDNNVGELSGPDLNSDGKELTNAQRRAFEDHGRYTQVGADDRLELGAQSDKLPGLRTHARDSMVAMGVNRDVADGVGGPQDEFFGEQTQGLFDTESQMRALHNQGATFNQDELNTALGADDFDASKFDASQYVDDWGNQLKAGDEIELPNGNTITVPDGVNASDVENATAEALENFDALANDDGFIPRDRLAQLEGGEDLANNLDELIWASPHDAGAAAWNGLSKGDLQDIQSRLQNGESISEIARDARNSGNARGTLGLDRNPSRADFRNAVQQRRNTDAANNVVNNFDDLANRHGFVSKNDLQNTPGGEQLAEYFDALIFSHATDPNNRQGWNGLSQQDLQGIQSRLNNGDSLQEIVQDAMNNSSIGRQLGDDFTFEDFQREVQNIRQERFPERPQRRYHFA